VGNGAALDVHDILSEPKLPVRAMVIDAEASSRCVQSRANPIERLPDDRMGPSPNMRSEN
jgi:hypothetical protein